MCGRRNRTVPGAGGNARRESTWPANERLGAAAHLLQKEIAAVRNAAIKRDGCEVRAAFTLVRGPICDVGHERAGGALQAAEKRVVSADRTNLAVIVAAFRTEMHQLQQAAEVAGADLIAGEAGHFAHAVRNLDA